jgi:two-component system, NtrC family, response regulator AtoC
MTSGGRSGDATTVVEPRSGLRSSAPRLSLRVVGDDILDSFPLPPNGEVVVGRGEESDLRIDHPSISRKHAKVIADTDGVRIVDLGSANGTRLGDRALEPGESVLLDPGEVVDLGSVMLILQRGYSGRRLRRLLPHGYFEARVEEECERSARTGAPFAVARLRAEGPGAPSAIELALAEVLRGSDVAGLYAPGEYEVLLPERSGEQALELLARVEGIASDRGTAVASGFACYPQGGRSAETLVAAACRALPGEADGQPDPAAPSVVVSDPAMERVQRLIRRVAPGTINVLLLGETGVGKEVAADMVHSLSKRAAGPFLRLNCGGFSESLLESELFGHEKGAFTGAHQAKTGLLESADGGTVFLDEIGELPAALQVKLLRVLEDRQVMRVGALRPKRIDVRFVAATNRNLEEEVARGAFREDLYYRVNGIAIVIPPLRERVGEIQQLARLFVAEAARAAGLPEPRLSDQAIELLESYAWPGNIRELRNLMERAVLLSSDDLITDEHLPTEKMRTGGVARAAGEQPAAPARGATLRDDVDDLERRRILDALDSCSGNQTRAARMLGISRNTLAARLEQFGIPRPRKR